ncbi:MAG TPA: Asp-tRNA(Asn)/Glu-tRNA(Gln) amidotransferase subunit GatC [Phycisphaerae bacterium]|jgi:aspartyl-tRNA(Asn)/glutamyl-tRNA(Gln) amidotransferase subunit C|nr:Asp-tRNA(Asn)/Glu-tRNA(Gln) amidotransferase subunit GatC [Phycisphaerae bacterium]
MADGTEKLDEAQVRHVAKLARLKLTDADVGRYATQLTAILDYVAQLKAVDVTGAEPMAHPLPLKNVLREDVVRPGLSTDEVLANAPAREGPYFAVPKVLDTGMGGG